MWSVRCDLSPMQNERFGHSQLYANYTVWRFTFGMMCLPWAVRAVTTLLPQRYSLLRRCAQLQPSIPRG